MMPELKDGDVYKVALEYGYATSLHAAMDGMHELWGGATMKIRNGWCYLYVKRKRVFDCNPIYARHHFKVKE